MTAAPDNRVRPRRPLFQKYFIALIVAVIAPLLVNGASDAWFAYRDQRAMVDGRLRIEATAAAARIEAFLDDIRNQMAWTVQVPWTDGGAQQHRLDALRLLRLVPAVVSVTLVDGTGIERLHLSRVGRDVTESGADRSADPAVAGVREASVWYGPVTLNRGSEPYMTMAVAGSRPAAGVALAEINLKLIWDVISAIQVGATGRALVVDANGRLVAHPNISLVLRGDDAATATRLKALQAATASAGGVPVATADSAGRPVLAAMAPVAGADWMVFAELPTAEAFAPLRAVLWRTGLLVLAGAALAVSVAYFLARRMSGPIQQLEDGAERIGAGQFDHRIDIRTGDELERLATRFNQMSRELAQSQEQAERIGRLRRFLAPQVAELVEQAGQETLLDGQRTDVVVIFCDLRGFTAFSSRAEPEEVMSVLGEYHEALGTIIGYYAGTLISFSGDGLMVLLNAPVQCPDDPVLRAVRMAIDMQKSVQDLIGGWRARGHAIGFGIGLARGTATVGRIGYEGRHDYTAIGSVTNLASHLCAGAEDGQILVDAATVATIGAAVPLVALGTRSIKGFGEAVAVYAVAEEPAALSSDRDIVPREVAW
jgi:class 3 adenylate cyclase